MSATTASNEWHGITRNEIHWNPTVVEDRCIGCGLCVTSCGRNVYKFDFEKNKPIVQNPEQCMVGCTTCATLCLQDAIEFPSRGYIRNVVRKKKVLRVSKDLLKGNTDKYQISKSVMPQ